jgi:hypothetical protein
MESIKAGDAIDFGIRTNIWTYFKSSNFTISGIDKR